ncbi:hypothetical protein AAHH79_33575, partial [Burkholderia pseudomallei]
LELYIDATVLWVVDSPVINDVTTLFGVLMPDEAAVDSEAIELFAELRPVDVEVDSDAIELLDDESPVEVEVDKLSNALVVELKHVLR